MGSFRLSWEEARAFAIEHLRRRAEGHRAFLVDDEWREEIWTIEHGEPTLVTKGD
jgi:hypothetical protein